MIEAELSGDGIGKKPGQPSPRPPREVREQLHGCLDKCVDALFELIDAVLTSGHVTSPVHLSLATADRCGWVSLYAALEKGQIDAEAGAIF